MGLTKTITGTHLNKTFDKFEKNCDYTIAIAGNPNVGKSTIFNSLTGLHQHTGNWTGKTVENARGITKFNNSNFLLVDIPGTYSLMSSSSEEEIARDYICFENPDCIIVVVDATTLERNLNLVYQILEITDKVVVCVNLLDEARKKGIYINLDKLSKHLQVPVVGTIARKKKTLQKLMSSVETVCKSTSSSNSIKIHYSKDIENAITNISQELESILKDSTFKNYRWISLKLLNGNEDIITSIEKHLEINLSENEKINKIKTNNLFKNNIISTILFTCENISIDITEYAKTQNRTSKLDKFLTSKLTGIPIMIIFFTFILWLTLIGSNYPSSLLFDFFNNLETKIFNFFVSINSPTWLTELLVSGMYRTLTWIVAVMLPPMAIFFPLFTILEDLGYLPRIVFNLDNFFHKACTSGKQALTMCMGLGCNAAGVTGCRIIDSPREKLIAIITNVFMPCNGRLPFLITTSSIFIASNYTGFLSSIIPAIVIISMIILGVIMTLITSKILSKTLLKGLPSSFVLELPPFRKPQFMKILVRSIFDRTLYVLGRAILFAAPCGIVLWLFANINIFGISILNHIASFLDPFATLMGLDGYILTAFILAIPANEIVLPVILMAYLANGSLIDIENTLEIRNILIQNGWTLITAINVMIFTLMHFPCSTTLMTIKKETNSWKWTIVSFLLPTLCGIIVCIITNAIGSLL